MKRTVLSALALASMLTLSACGDGEETPTPAEPAPASTPAPAEEGESPSPTVESPTETPSEEAPEEGPAEETPTEEPAEEPSEEPAGDSTRFQTTATDLTAIFTDIMEKTTEDPKTVADANRIAGLDDSTTMKFASYEDSGSEGAFCLGHNDLATYAAIQVTEEKVLLLFGDGECSYDQARASVVGDLLADRWMKGGALMKGKTPGTVLAGA